MPTLFRCLMAQQPPGQPLIGNNLGFFAVVGGVLFLLLLPMVLWLRRRPDKTEPRP